MTDRTMRKRERTGPGHAMARRPADDVSPFAANRSCDASRRILTILRVAFLPATLLAVAVGCDDRTVETPPQALRAPIVEETYALDETNRPLDDAELADAGARLNADPQAFLQELEQAPPVRQASLIFVLQRDPQQASAARATLERLAASDHGIVRRAAKFALATIDETSLVEAARDDVEASAK